MRKLIFLVHFLLLITATSVAEIKNETFLIRKAYLDILGTVPTPEEMEWYMVYNDNSYEKAIDYLIKHPKNKWIHLSNETSKNILTSKEYKEKRRNLTPKQIENIISYVSGDIYMNNILLYNKTKLVNDAIRTNTKELDIIDYLSNCLLCRSTNLEEANPESSLPSRTNPRSESANTLNANDIAASPSCSVIIHVAKAR